MHMLMSNRASNVGSWPVEGHTCSGRPPDLGRFVSTALYLQATSCPRASTLHQPVLSVQVAYSLPVRSNTMLYCTPRCMSSRELRSCQTFAHTFSINRPDINSSCRVRSTMHSDKSQSAAETTTQQDADARSLLQDIERIKTQSGGYPDKKPLSKVQGAVQETIGWLRHVIQDPEDFSSAAIGRMVSKEYGKHEPPHTEHHMWRTGHTLRPSPPSSPMAHPQQTHSTPTTQRGTSGAAVNMSPTFAAIARTVAEAAAPAGCVDCAGLQQVRDVEGLGGAGGDSSQAVGSRSGTVDSQQAANMARVLEQQD